MLPQSYLPTSLPRWAYFLLSALCVIMGLWASYITLQYFEHGARALESDPALQALAVSAALMFVASEMGSFGLAALLTEAQLWARRWLLTGFAAAVLALEVVTIVAVNLALTTGADMTQTTVQSTVAGLQRQIVALEKSVATLTATAESLRVADQLKKSMQASDKAAAEQDKLAPLYAELKTAQGQKRPTLVGMLGHDNAIYYAVARGILVSLGGLVFFGTAGALMRVGRSAGAGASAAPADAPIDAPAPAETVAPAPALASFKHAETVAPKDYSSGLAYSSKIKLAGASLLAGAGALTAPITHAAPAVPGAAAGATGAPKQAHTGAPEQAQSATQPAAKKRVRTATARAQGTKLDTGTTGHAATRYNRIKAAVKAGKLKPSTRALQAAEGGGGAVVAAYLQQLETDGVIVRTGRGYELKGGAK